METENELIVRKQDVFCTLIINRPEKHNVLTQPCLDQITRTMEDVASDDEIRVVIISGAGGKAFSAGYNIASLPTEPAEGDEKSLRETPPLERALQAVESCPCPVIAMLNGLTLGGGCELAMSCDIRLAGKSVRMGMPPAKLGIVYPYDGYRRFLRVLGFSRTMEIFLTGRAYDSETCLRMGLVNHVVEDGELETFTHDMAGELASNAPLSMWGTKKALHGISAYPVLPQDEEEAIRSLFIRSLKSRDLQEGQRAFAEKRKPVFTGE